MITKNIKSIYLMMALCLASFALAMKTEDEAALEELPLELLKMTYDKLHPDSKRTFLGLSKRLSCLRNLSKRTTLRDEKGIPCLLRMERLEDLRIYCKLSPEGVNALRPVLKNLRILSFSNNSIMDESLAALAPYLTQLQRLHLQECHTLTNEGLRCLAELTSLEWLELSGSSISDIGVGYVAKLPQLQQLDLSGSSISKNGIKCLQGARKLWQLNLSDCLGLKNMGMNLNGLSQLRKLDLSGCDRMDDEVIMDWLGGGGLFLLESLNLSDTEVTKLSPLAGLLQLRDLDLSGTSVTDEDLRQLEGLTSLQRLNVERCFHVTQAGIGRLLQRYPSLRIEF